MNTLKLRALTSRDITKTLEWNNQEDIKNYYAGHPFPVNLEMEEEWYNRILKSNLPTTVFGIEMVEKKKLIGLSLLKKIDFICRKAEFAIYIGDIQERGKGYSKEATLATLKFGFNQLGLNRIFLNVRTSNELAINLYNKVGFKIEGEMRESVFVNGKYHNEFVMSVLHADYLSANEL